MIVQHKRVFQDQLEGITNYLKNDYQNQVEFDLKTLLINFHVVKK